MRARTIAVMLVGAGLAAGQKQGAQPPQPEAPPQAPVPRTILGEKIRTHVRGEMDAMRDSMRELARSAGSSRGETEYYHGRESLDRRRYDDAVQHFDRVIKGKGDRADAAHYWKAYTLHRLGKIEEARAALEAMRSQYPQSRWADDAQALAVEMSRSAGQPVSPETAANEDIKLLALSGLVEADPERAVPAVEKILKSTNSAAVKERALFVLAQAKNDSARNLLVGVAKGGGNPDLQLKAIQYLSAIDGPKNAPLLSEIYRSTNDKAVKRSVLRGLGMSKSVDALAAAAREEKDPDVRREAIRYLAMGGGADEVWKLYQGESDVAVREYILQSLSMANSNDRLVEAFKNEKEPRLRRAAVRSLGMRKYEGLAALYGEEKDAAVRREIVNQLGARRNATALVDIARKESDPELRRAIVERLSTMKSKEATDYLLEVLNK